MNAEYKKPEFELVKYNVDDVLEVSKQKDNADIDFSELISGNQGSGNQGGTP